MVGVDKVSASAWDFVEIVVLVYALDAPALTVASDYFADFVCPERALDPIVIRPYSLHRFSQLNYRTCGGSNIRDFMLRVRSCFSCV
jgi:hypothetical protein